MFLVRVSSSMSWSRFWTSDPDSIESPDKMDESLLLIWCRIRLTIRRTLSFSPEPINGEPESAKKEKSFSMD